MVTNGSFSHLVKMERSTPNAKHGGTGQPNRMLVTIEGE